jgi:DNA-binding IclR family transcriptional regulator
MGNPKRQLDPFWFESDREHPQFVSAAARCLSILRCFDYGEQFLGNREIALRTGLPKPTVSRLTFTMARLGCLSYSRAREKYALGVGLLSLGHTYQRSNPVIAIATPLMQACARETGSTVMLGAPDGMRMVLLAIAASPSGEDFGLHPGTRVPHGLTALGRADLAGRRPELFEREMLELQQECRPFAWPRIRDGILKARADVARIGYCHSLGAWCPDVYAVGVPMISRLDPDRIVAFSCGGPAATMSAERLTHEIAPRLIGLRDDVLQATGGDF